MNLSFDDEEVAPVELAQSTSSESTKKVATGAVNAPIGPVSPNDSMKDIHQKLRSSTKNDRDAIYASAREQDLLKKMASADELRRRFGDAPTTIRSGDERVNILARRVRAISSDGESIEIDMTEFKKSNREKYLQDIGKLPKPQTESSAKKKSAKESLEFDE